MTLLSDKTRGLADRISPRHVFEARIRIRLQRGSRRLALQGAAREFSESGMGGFVAEALGEFVTLDIPLYNPTNW